MKTTRRIAIVGAITGAVSFGLSKLGLASPPRLFRPRELAGGQIWTNGEITIWLLQLEHPEDSWAILLYDADPVHEFQRSVRRWLVAQGLPSTVELAAKLRDWQYKGQLNASIVKEAEYIYLLGRLHGREASVGQALDEKLREQTIDR